MFVLGGAAVAPPRKPLNPSRRFSPTYICVSGESVAASRRPFAGPGFEPGFSAEQARFAFHEAGEHSAAPSRSRAGFREARPNKMAARVHGPMRPSFAHLSADGDQPPTARLRESPAWLSAAYIRRGQLSRNAEAPTLRISFHICNWHCHLPGCHPCNGGPFGQGVPCQYESM